MLMGAAEKVSIVCPKLKSLTYTILTWYPSQHARTHYKGYRQEDLVYRFIKGVQMEIDSTKLSSKTKQEI